MEYFGVKNFEKYQHYQVGKNAGSPKWIKMHLSLLDDYEFNALTDTQQCHLMKIWMLAAALSNHLPCSQEFIKGRINAGRGFDLNTLLQTKFLYLKELRGRNPRTEVEKRREEVEKEKETPKEVVSAKPRLSFGYSSSDMMQAEVMQGHIVQVVPDFRTTNGNSVEEWAEQIHEMRTCDRRSYADIADMWEFAQVHKWWRSRILSPASLRKHWNTLSAQKNNPDEEVKPQWIIDKENAAAKHEEEMLAIERRAFEKVEAKCR